MSKQNKQNISGSVPFPSLSSYAQSENSRPEYKHKDGTNVIWQFLIYDTV